MSSKSLKDLLNSLTITYFRLYVIRSLKLPSEGRGEKKSFCRHITWNKKLLRFQFSSFLFLVSFSFACSTRKRMQRRERQNWRDEILMTNTFFQRDNHKSILRENYTVVDVTRITNLSCKKIFVFSFISTNKIFFFNY